MFSNLLEQPQPLPHQLAEAQRVLIVDNEDETVNWLIWSLQRQGFQTLTAASGATGLELARTARPAVVLLDQRLPDTDGLTVCQKLVDSPETCGIPVIILSRTEHPEILRRCRAAGCHFYVRKPYDPNVLLVLIRQAIEDVGRWREVG